MSFARAQRFEQASSARARPADGGGDDDNARSAKRSRFDADSNSGVGQQMLMKLGWSRGKGLGKEEQGRTAPIQPSTTIGHSGLGKDAFDTSLTSATTSSNRTLESERIANETEAERAERLARVQEKARQKADVLEAIEKFRCVMCDKQYLTIGQYEEHCKTYEHHHRARNVAAKQEAKEALMASGELDRRRAKEQKREEKELRKMMGASLQKAPAASTASPASTLRSTSTSTSRSTSTAEGLKKKGGFKPIGFKPISLSSSTASALSMSGSKPRAMPDDEDDAPPPTKG